MALFPFFGAFFSGARVYTDTIHAKERIVAGMDNIINKIFEIDKQAQRLIDYAEDKEDLMKQALEKEREELIKSLEDKSRERLNNVSKTENEYADGKIAAIDEKKQKTLEEFDEKYNSCHNDWENSIYKRVFENA